MNDAIISALIGALSGAVIAAVGWTVAWWQAERSRRREAIWDHLKQQIGELYGPLAGLLTDLTTVLGIRNTLLEIGPDGKIAFRNNSQDVEVARFFEENYIFPLNRDMRRLIISKRHLLDSEHLPQSFQDFLQYGAEYESLYELWKATKPHIESDKGYLGKKYLRKEYPNSFGDEVRDKLEHLLSQQKQYIRLNQRQLPHP